ncbi:hypothetical protein B566_EDAN006483 [Ephemera danica]|nr:hypothetical protein B566_EDAN006483 [Ephemera danica]
MKLTAVMETEMRNVSVYYTKAQCIAPLGMESGAIRDDDISASSSFDSGNVGPQHGREVVSLDGYIGCEGEADHICILGTASFVMTMSKASERAPGKQATTLTPETDKKPM